MASYERVETRCHYAYRVDGPQIYTGQDTASQQNKVLIPTLRETPMPSGTVWCQK